MKFSVSLLVTSCAGPDEPGTTIHQALEILPELAGTFEIVLLADLMDDEAREDAAWLAMTYPQVRLHRSALRYRGTRVLAEAIESCASQCVAWQAADSPIGIGHLPRLWPWMGDYDLVVGRSVSAKAARLPSPEGLSSSGTAALWLGLLPPDGLFLVRQQAVLLGRLSEGGLPARPWLEIRIPESVPTPHVRVRESYRAADAFTWSPAATLAAF